MMDENRRPTTRASTPMFSETSSLPSRIGNMIDSVPNLSSSTISIRNNSFSGYDPTPISCDGSPITMSPWNQNSHFAQSPCSNNFNQTNNNNVTQNQNSPNVSIIGSIIREEGHVYSLAAKSDVLYTGSDSKNIRVWKNMEEVSAFKSNSGLVKSIIISGDKILSGHQDGKIRVWKVNEKNPSVHKRSGTLPTLIDILKASVRPKNYVEVKRKRRTLWMKHSDAISSLSMCEEHGLLYSASWDRTVKVWRIENSKCVESIKAHDDAVNSVVSSVGCIVYSGSADGTVKVWKREIIGKSTTHVFVQNLLKQDCAVTALAVNKSGSLVYGGSSDGLVHFWERDNKYSHGGVLKGHKLAVLCLSAAGKLVFTGSADKTICVWRRDGTDTVHTCLSVLTGHRGPVKCLAVEEEEEEDSSHGNQRFVVYSGSLDKSVKVWSVSERAPHEDINKMEIFNQDHQNAASDTVSPPNYSPFLL